MNDITISAETISRVLFVLQQLANLGSLLLITSALTALVVREHYKRD
jgi:hypothetical protein